MKFLAWYIRVGALAVFALAVLYLAIITIMTMWGFYTGQFSWT